MEKAAKKPNLLYVFADQWRYEAVGCHHADQVVTPNFDQFAFLMHTAPFRCVHRIVHLY